jgi:hypothetical protein
VDRTRLFVNLLFKRPGDSSAVVYLADRLTGIRLIPVSLDAKFFNRCVTPQSSGSFAMRYCAVIVLKGKRRQSFHTK